jgi:hypothetical protein
MKRRIRHRTKKQFQVESLEGRLAPSSLVAAPPLGAVLGVHGNSGENVNPDHPTTGSALPGLDNHFDVYG